MTTYNSVSVHGSAPQLGITGLLLVALMRIYARALSKISAEFPIVRTSTMSFRDDWPKMPDGTDFDGQQLLALARSGKSPFHGVWDVNLLIQEIEENLGAKVIDIPTISNGSNNYVSSSQFPSASPISVPFSED